MKRPNRSDSMVCTDQETELIPNICLSGTEEKLVYNKRERSFLVDNLGEEEDEIIGDGDAGGGSLALGEKKRRLSIDQVKALEKNFEVENKLEPERKVKLAHELGLQPRQVAVWFQNRRARWKTKQLERDYGVLKAEYDSLLLDHEALKRDTDALLAEIKELKAKVGGEDGSSVKEEMVENVKLEMTITTTQEEVVFEENDVELEDQNLLPALIYKDGSSDSDTSAILNDDGSCGISSSFPSGLTSKLHIYGLQEQQQRLMFMGPDISSSSQFHCGLPQWKHLNQEEQILAMEERDRYHDDDDDEDDDDDDFLHGSSNIFSYEQAPTLSWYCSDQQK